MISGEHAIPVLRTIIQRSLYYNGFYYKNNEFSFSFLARVHRVTDEKVRTIVIFFTSLYTLHQGAVDVPAASDYIVEGCARRETPPCRMKERREPSETPWVP